MEQEQTQQIQTNKIETNFNISKEDKQHEEIVRKIVQIIQKLDNSAFKTLLTFIVNTNLQINNIQQALESGVTVIDETQENEYLIQMKPGFFCISIINSIKEEYVGEMITFECSGVNDIFVSVIDEDILEIDSNATADDKRKIIVEKMIQPLFVGLTCKVKQVLQKELQLNIIEEILTTDDIIYTLEKERNKIISIATPGIMVFIWQKLIGDYLRTENSLKDVIEKHYSSEKVSLVILLREIYECIVIEMIVKYGYTSISNKYPQIIQYYEIIKEYFDDDNNVFTTNTTKEKYKIFRKAIVIDLSNDAMMLKNREKLQKFISKRLKHYTSLYLLKIIRHLLNTVVHNENISHRYKEDFLINVLVLESVREHTELVEIISQFNFSDESIVTQLKELKSKKHFDSNEIFERYYQYKEKKLSILEMYTIIRATKHKPTFEYLLKQIIDDENIDSKDKTFIFKKIMSNRTIFDNLLTMKTFNMIFNLHNYEVNHYITVIEAFGRMYLQGDNNSNLDFLINYTNYYEVAFYKYLNVLFNLQQCFKNQITRATKEDLLHILNESKFVQHNKELLNQIERHHNCSSSMEKIVCDLKSVCDNYIPESPEAVILYNESNNEKDEILRKEVLLTNMMKNNETYSNENEETKSDSQKTSASKITQKLFHCNEKDFFTVLKNTKSSMFVFVVINHLNSQKTCFDDIDFDSFIEQFIMNVNIEPTFWFDAEMKSSFPKYIILNYIESLFNNISVIVVRDEYYSCDQSQSYFIIRTEEQAIAKSKTSFDTFMKYISLAFEGVSGTYQMIDELRLSYDCLTNEEELFCNKYLSKIAYQKTKEIAKNPMVYSEMLHYMVVSSWFVQDRLDILEKIMFNPMCMEKTKEIILKNVLPKKIVEYDELMIIEHKEFLINVIEKCKMSKQTVMKYQRVNNTFMKDDDIVLLIENNVEFKKKGNVLEKLSVEELKELNNLEKYHSERISKTLSKDDEIKNE